MTNQMLIVFYFKYRMKFLLPGHKYLGPGNPINNGKPVNKADEIARQHDIAYDKSTTKNEIFNADEKAIASFSKEKGISNTIGEFGLSTKHFVEKGINRTIYPWNLPDKQQPMSNRRSSNNINQQSKFQRTNSKTISSTTSDNTDGIISTEMSNDNSANAAGDAAAQTMDGNKQGGSLHGQTATIFKGSPQDVNYVSFTFKKTYRWTSESTLPAHKYSPEFGAQIFKIGSAFRLPVEYCWFYMSPEEFSHLQYYNEVYVEHASCEVYNYGIRLPFTTNEAQSVTANASAQYPLCEWVGIDNDYNMYCDPGQLNEIREKCVGNSDFCQAQNEPFSTEFSNLSARATSRSYDLEACITLPAYNDNGFPYTPNTNEYARVINGTMNLDKCFSWNHTSKFGLIWHRRLNPHPINEDEVHLKNCNIWNLPNKTINASHGVLEFMDGKKIFDKYTTRKNVPYEHSIIEDCYSFTPDSPTINYNRIRPFIVGMQFLRNNDDTLLKGTWEFATTCSITVRCKKGLQGRYWDTPGRFDNGFYTRLQGGTDNHSMIPTPCIYGMQNQLLTNVALQQAAKQTNNEGDKFAKSGKQEKDKTATVKNNPTANSTNKTTLYPEFEVDSIAELKRLRELVKNQTTSNQRG